MVIVTGATGHIGNVLVRRLVKEGYEVGIIVHKKPAEEVFSDIKYKIFEGDITDYESLLKPFKNAEAVFHLAAKISITSGEYQELYKINVLGTENVVKACKAAKVKRLVYVSSVHACMETPKGIPITENVPETTRGVVGDYARTKILAYHKVMDGVREGLDAVVVFPTGVIGPFDARPSQIGQMVRDYVAEKPVQYIDGGYNFVDVRDVVNGIMLAFKKGQTGEGYLLGGTKVSVLDMYKELEKVTNLKIKLNKVPTQFALLLSYPAEFFAKALKKEPIFTPYSVKTLNSNSLISSEKAQIELGYNPRPFEQTIKDEVSWFKGNQVSIY